jgi:hypothetical protein
VNTPSPGAFWSGDMAPFQICSWTIPVVAVVGNVSSVNQATVTSTNAGSNSTTASLFIWADPIISKSFSGLPALSGATTEMIISLNNPNSFPLAGASLFDTFPSPLEVRTAPLLASGPGTCPFMVNTSLSSVSLSGAIPANSICTYSVGVSSTQSTTNSFSLFSS